MVRTECVKPNYCLMTANPGVIDVFEIKSVRLENDHDVMYIYKLASAITSRFIMTI